MAKRGNNEGSIYKRADDRWAATINLGWQDGKRKRKTFYAKTRREVQEQLTKALRDHQQTLPITSDRQESRHILKCTSDMGLNIIRLILCGHGANVGHYFLEITEKSSLLMEKPHFAAV